MNLSSDSETNQELFLWKLEQIDKELWFFDDQQHFITLGTRNRHLFERFWNIQA